jgi:hypothetical protein
MPRFFGAFLAEAGRNTKNAPTNRGMAAWTGCATWLRYIVWQELQVVGVKAVAWTWEVCLVAE